MAKTKSIDVLTDAPVAGNKPGSDAAIYYGSSMPALDTHTPMHVFERDSPNPSQHPRKTNPGGMMRYYG